MADTLRLMQLVDAMGTARDLNELCRVVAQSTAWPQRFHSVVVGAYQPDEGLVEVGRFDLPGEPGSGYRTLPRLSDIPSAFQKAPSGVVVALPANEFASETSCWVVPIRSHGDRFGLLACWAHEDVTSLPVAEAQEHLVATGVKLGLRQHVAARPDAHRHAS